MLLVEVGELAGELRRLEDREERVGELDDGHVEAKPAEGRRRLHADEAAAYADGAPGGRRGLTDARRVFERPQREDTLEVGARHVERARPGPRREQQLLEGQRLAAVELEPPLAVQDALRRALQQEFDVLLGVEGLGLDERSLAVGLASEIPLRER